MLCRAKIVPFPTGSPWLRFWSPRTHAALYALARQPQKRLYVVPPRCGGEDRLPDLEAAVSSENQRLRFSALGRDAMSVAELGASKPETVALAPYTDRSKRRFSRRELVQYIQDTYGISYSIGWFGKLAVTGGGPPFVKVGRYPRYDVADIDEWMASRTSGLKYSTSDRT